MRLIDADVLELRIKALQEYGTSENNGRGWACNFLNDWQEPSTEWSVVESLIADLPTIDAAPVVHAKWIGVEYDGYADGVPVFDLWQCSSCGTEHEGECDSLTRYCPNCGAKME